jgi:hypothetical protein
VWCSNGRVSVLHFLFLVLSCLGGGVRSVVWWLRRGIAKCSHTPFCIVFVM